MIRFPLTPYRDRRRRVGLLPVLMLALTAACPRPLLAEPPAPVGLTGSQADAILEELKQIRALLEEMKKDRQGVAQAPTRPVTPPTAEVSIAGDPALGAPDAPVTVVEFTDYQCPYCLRFVQNTFTRLEADYIDTGKVRWVVRDMPLGFHAHARKAAQAAHCAGEQDRFWEMRTVLFTNAKQLEAERLPRYAQIIGLDQDAFDACLSSDRHLAQIDADIRDASEAKITGTPTFVVGRADGDRVQGRRIIGARDYQVFAAEIDKLLKGDAPVPAKTGAADKPQAPRS